jgi:hypothetical protein
MRSRRARHGAAGAGMHGIDRMVRKVETGRFKRSLCLTLPGVSVLPPGRVRRLLRANSQPRSVPMKEGPQE